MHVTECWMWVFHQKYLNVQKKVEQRLDSGEYVPFIYPDEAFRAAIYLLEPAFSVQLPDWGPL